MSRDEAPKMNADGTLKSSIDLAAARAKLAGPDAPRFWQSLEELSNTRSFRGFLEN